ncbi:hypothetical protein sce1512 [Sorangium cellulosum So ce56]|uniref:Uncharacterized protein n=1 Tax=Sorangium cellulosum (strain So ce56) TaxID=448385 RepID=A9FCJ8_SORC5|nr:hypothetical protein sce1512 [Sorangium cellulosum So ce56]
MSEITTVSYRRDVPARQLRRTPSERGAPNEP